MTGYYFSHADQALRPAPEAHAPWATDMLHGRLLGGVAARALEAEFGDHGWRAARLTVDLFRPSAMAPVHVTVSPVRVGRRVRVADAEIECDGHAVARVTAVFLPVSEDPPGKVWEPVAAPWPEPDAVLADEAPAGAAEVDGWQFRGVDGGFGTGERTRVWTNDTWSLVDGEVMSPLVRTAVSGDVACPLANSSDQGLHYINADYTMLIGRYPVGSWVGLEVDHRIAADGISVAGATLVDRDGPFATSGGTSLVRPPLEPPA